MPGRMPPEPNYPPMYRFGNPTSFGTRPPANPHNLPPLPTYHTQPLTTSMPLGSLPAVHSIPGMNNLQMSNGSSHQEQPPSAAPDDLRGLSLSRDGRTYKLEIVQQPMRARMCGFGDKDRRPITPPPCVRLIVIDDQTGQEVAPENVNHSFFVLSVDLWDGTGQNEVNLVRHSNTSPTVSISAATTCAYPPPPERPYLGLLNPHQMQAFTMHTQGPPQPQQYATHGPPQPQQYAITGYGSTAMHNGAHQDPYTSSQVSPMTPHYPQLQPQFPGQHGYGLPGGAGGNTVHVVPQTSSGMFTRNLIGSLAVNALKLEDEKHKAGIWFVLQDLSVRTEGPFRLKMRFIDVSDQDGREGRVTTENAPVLATAFSESFDVYSAKKFPGVVESTQLSRSFAAQGVKIPIRKDGNKLANEEEYANDE